MSSSLTIGFIFLAFILTSVGFFLAAYIGLTQLMFADKPRQQQLASWAEQNGLQAKLNIPTPNKPFGLMRENRLSGSLNGHQLIMVDRPGNTAISRYTTTAEFQLYDETEFRYDVTVQGLYIGRIQPVGIRAIDSKFAVTHESNAWTHNLLAPAPIQAKLRDVIETGKQEKLIITSKGAIRFVTHSRALDLARLDSIADLLVTIADQIAWLAQYAPQSAETKIDFPPDYSGLTMATYAPEFDAMISDLGDAVAKLSLKQQN